jgi:hypothetical protein
VRSNITATDLKEARWTPPVPSYRRDDEIQMFVPGKLKNMKSTGHWRDHASHVGTWRDRAIARLEALKLEGWPWAPSDPKTVEFVIHARRGFDDDNWRLLASPVRDCLQMPREATRKGGRPRRGVGLIHHDGPESGHEFIYRQERVPGGVQQGISVRVSRRPL